MKRKIILVCAALVVSLVLCGLLAGSIVPPKSAPDTLDTAKAAAVVAVPKAETAAVASPTQKTADAEAEAKKKAEEEAAKKAEAEKKAAEEAKKAEEARKAEEAKKAALPQSSTSVKGLGIVSSSDVCMRSDANTSASVLMTLNKGNAVAVKDVSGDWYRVNYDGCTGYVSSSYLTVYGDASGLAAYGKVTANDSLNLRSSAGGSVVTSIPGGYYVDVTGFNGGWYAVNYNGKSGYVSGDYLALVSAKGTNPVVETPAATTETTTVTGSGTGAQIASKAQEYVGYSYVYGGAGPTSFDCSGFTMYIYGLYGYTLSHGASYQYNEGTHISQSELQPGDLVFFTPYNSSSQSIGHVGIYIGNREFVHASTEKTGVIISSLDGSSYPSRYYGACRIAS